VKKNARNFIKLFQTTFFLSAFTFGGGYVIIPLMKKKFVDALGWLEEEEMLNIAAIAQSSPGAMAVNASILVGWRLMGLSGALVAILGTVLPPLIILSVVSLFYQAFRENEIVAAVLRGMMAGVCAVIIDVVITMGGGILRMRKILPILIMAGVFIAHYVLHINVACLIMTCAIVGALAGLRERRAGEERTGQ
jgi:chromate transporter